MIKYVNEMDMGESLSPWDYEREPADKATPKRKKKVEKEPVKSRYQLKRDDDSRNKTATRSQGRSFIKLQARITTEVVLIDQKNSQNQNTAANLVVKLPNKFKTIQPKKLPERPFRPPFSNRDSIVPKQKTSMRNFMQQIQQLDKLKLHRKLSRQTLLRGQSQVNISTSRDIVKKCSLKNIHPYNEQVQFANKITAAKSKLAKSDKKHILDRILARFQ